MLFEELCAYHAALMCGVGNEAVAIATGLSTPTVSYLRHAGKHIGGQIRYPAVARERRNLGDEAFVRKYATPLIRDRVAAAAEQVRLKQTTPKPPGAIRPNAKRFAGSHQATEYGGSKWEFTVRLSTEPPVGWLWGTTFEPGRGHIKPEHIRWQGDPERQGRGYATSTEAYSAFINMINPKD
jgi:hypothetical protein